MTAGLSTAISFDQHGESAGERPALRAVRGHAHRAAPALPAVRRRWLAEALLSSGALSVRDVVAATAVSSATARRDLDELARRGIAMRVHGGAVAHHVLPR